LYSPPVTPRELAIPAAIILPSCSQKNEDPKNKTPKKKAVVVKTTTVKPEDFLDTVTGIGTLKAQQIVEISPELDGIIQNIHFDEGAKVKKNRVIIKQ